MDRKESKKVKVPIIVPKICYRKLYTEVKIYIPKRINAAGNKVADVSKGANWYVYFYFRNPVSLKMEKYNYKKGINHLKTVAERREAATELKNRLSVLLQDGFNPFEKYSKNSLEEPESENKITTTLEAFDLAFKSRCNEWKQSTRNTNASIYKIFKEWLKEYRLTEIDITQFKRKRIVQFLDYMIEVRNANATTRNNYKRAISSILSKMVEMEFLEFNPADKIKLIKENPTKNKPFSNEQLITIKTWLQNNDPYLHSFLKFITYGFMRPTEVTRIKIKDVDLQQKTIIVDTKTNINIIPIIETLENVILEMNLEIYDPEFNLFSTKEKPGIWITENDKSKSNFFSARFLKLKKHFNFGIEFGMYSFRHNAALNLFHSFVAGGLDENEAINKLQKIMRHSDAKTTRLYLRDIGAFKVNDYSNDYTFDF